MTYRKFLDASLVPLERALLARAEYLEATQQEMNDALTESYPDVARFRKELAQELRALAYELHEDGR